MTSIRDRPRAEFVFDPAELAAIEDGWRALAVAAENPFVTPEWFQVWLEAWQGAFEPFVIVVRHEGELSGVLPLARSVRRRELRFPSAGDFFELLARPGEVGVADAVVSCLHSLRPRWRRLTLERLDPDAAWLRTLLKPGTPLRATRTNAYELPYIDLRGLTWDTYLDSRSANLRQNVRRNLRVIERKHAVRFRSTARPTELEGDLDTLFRLHRRRREHGRSSLDDPRLEAVIRGFAARALDRGWLRLFTLELDGTPVAAQYGWRLGDRFLAYQSGFDPEWSRLGVGVACLAHSIHSAINENVAVYDMLLGREEWKDRFTTGVRPAIDLMVTAPADPARAIVAGKQALRRLRRAIK